MQVTVIGAASIDIFVKSRQQIVTGQSNPAIVSLRAGGEARNISSMLVRRNVDVSLITAVGNDTLGALLKDSCESLGIKTDAWIIRNSIHTCVNLDTLEPGGKLHTGFNEMTAPEAIKTNDILKHKNLIHDADLLILDLNLTEKILAAILEVRDGRPVLVDAVSADNAKRISKMLDKIHVLKLNRRQAESITGITLDSKERVKNACYKLACTGVGRVFITLGVAGACASDDRHTIIVPAIPVAVKDIAGAGAAFVTGLAMGMDYDLRAQTELAITYAGQHLEAFAK